MLIERLMNTSRLTGVMSVGEGEGTGTGTGEGTGGGGAAPWYQGIQGLESDVIGHIQNRGWHTMTPAQAAAEAAKAHREAERFLGVPKEQLVRLPKDAADEAGWNEVYSRLGQPKDAKEYDFSGVKFTDEAVLDTGDQDWLRQVATDLHLSKDAATKLAGHLVKHLEAGETTVAAESTAKLAEQRAELDRNWGANKEQNMFLAKQGAQKLGFDPDAIGALEQTFGYAKVMEAMRRVGQAGMEGKFVENQGAGAGGSGVTTRDQAVARKGELMRDASWQERYLAGDATAVREMRSLNVIIAGESDVNYQPA